MNDTGAKVVSYLGLKLRVHRARYIPLEPMTTGPTLKITSISSLFKKNKDIITTTGAKKDYLPF
jgi:hypothetical protein